MKNFEELKEAIKSNSFNESHLSSTQVVDLETVIALIEDFEQCNIANVVKPKGTLPVSLLDISQDEWIENCERIFGGSPNKG
jgi:hypothetical protein